MRRNSVYADPSILKLIIKDKKIGHWVLCWNGFIYDPSWGVFEKKLWENTISKYARVSSYLPLNPIRL